MCHGLVNMAREKDSMVERAAEDKEKDVLMPHVRVSAAEKDRFLAAFECYRSREAPDATLANWIRRAMRLQAGIDLAG